MELHIHFLLVHQLLKPLPVIALLDLYLSMPLLFGDCMLIRMLIVWRLFNDVLHVGCVDCTVFYYVCMQVCKTFVDCALLCNPCL